MEVYNFHNNPSGKSTCFSGLQRSWTLAYYQITNYTAVVLANFSKEIEILLNSFKQDVL